MCVGEWRRKPLLSRGNLEGPCQAGVPAPAPGRGVVWAKSLGKRGLLSPGARSLVQPHCDCRVWESPGPGRALSGAGPAADGAACLPGAGGDLPARVLGHGPVLGEKRYVWAGNRQARLVAFVSGRGDPERADPAFAACHTSPVSCPALRTRKQAWRGEPGPPPTPCGAALGFQPGGSRLQDAVLPCHPSGGSWLSSSRASNRVSGSGPQEEGRRALCPDRCA